MDKILQQNVSEDRGFQLQGLSLILDELAHLESQIRRTGVNMGELEQILTEKGMAPVLEKDLMKCHHISWGFIFENHVAAISWTTPDFES